MKLKLPTPIIQAAVVAGAAFLFAQTAPAAPVVRAGVLYFDYTASEYSGEVGGNIAAGVEWGTASEHEFVVEAAFVSWSWTPPAAAPLTRNGDGNLLPILASYRYRFGPVDARWRFFAGVSAGMVRQSGDLAIVGSGVNYGGSVSETNAAFGATLGVTLRLSDNVSGEIAYRYLGAGSAEMETQTFTGSGGYNGPAGPTVSLPEPSAHIAAAAITIRF